MWRNIPILKPSHVSSAKPPALCLCSNYFKSGSNSTEAEKCFGLALKISFVNDNKYQYWTKKGIWDHLSGPCPNCKRLIELWEGKKENFTIKYGSQGAPKEEDTSGAATTSSARYFRYKGLEKRSRL
jgi:hypothetical protein